MDAFFHAADIRNLTEKDSIEVSLVGQSESGTRTKLRTATIKAKQQRTEDLSFVFKKPTESFKLLDIEVKNPGDKTLILNMNFESSERQEVNLG